MKITSNNLLTKFSRFTNHENLKKLLKCFNAHNNSKTRLKASIYSIACKYKEKQTFLIYNQQAECVFWTSFEILIILFFLFHSKQGVNTTKMHEIVT